jgi:2,4-dienoyl-CoA reductase-like NADH-dependent reductase (Old Yellow Enzyme family)
MLTVEPWRSRANFSRRASTIGTRGRPRKSGLARGKELDNRTFVRNVLTNVRLQRLDLMLELPLCLPCGLLLPNRIAKASLSETMADAGGYPDARYVRLFERFAAGGAGLLLTGNVIVDGRYLEAPGNPVLESERALDAFAAWAGAARRHGARVVMQLNHAGQQTRRWTAARPVAPSAGPGVRVMGAFGRPRALAVAEIEDIIERFTRSAQLAERAGFCGVQVHAAHGYLLSQFLSPLTNRRSDEWGGNVDARARILLRIIERIRARVRPGFAVGVKLNSADFQRGGLAPDEALRVVELLDARVDFLEISGGTYEQPASFGKGLPERSRAREAYFLDFADRARGVARVPLLVTGGFRSRAAMEQALLRGSCDLIGMARPLALEPDLPRRLLSGAAVAARPSLRGRPPAFAELAWHAEQLERMGRGRAPAPGLWLWPAVLMRFGRELVRALARELQLRRPACRVAGGGPGTRGPGLDALGEPSAGAR